MNRRVHQAHTRANPGNDAIHIRRLTCNGNCVVISAKIFQGNIVETKTARLTILIDPERKRAFEELCAARDLTPSQVVRQLIRGYLEQSATDEPAGADASLPNHGSMKK